MIYLASPMVRVKVLTFKSGRRGDSTEFDVIKGYDDKRHRILVRGPGGKIEMTMLDSKRSCKQHNYQGEQKVK